MAFELVMEDAKLMGNIINIISSIVSECTVKVSDQGISIKAFDINKASMIDFFMKSDAFEKYAVDKPVEIGINLEKLNTILKTAASSEKLKISLDEEENRFIVEFTTTKKHRRFALGLIDVTEEEEVPDAVSMAFDVSFMAKASFIQQVIKDAELVSDYLTISASKNGISFSTVGETNEMNTFIHPESEEIDTESFSIKEDTSVDYALELLNNFLRGIRSSEYIQLSFSNERPIQIAYFLDEKGHLIYYVAPRIEELEELEEYEDYEEYDEDYDVDEE